MNELELELGSFFTETSTNKGNSILKAIKKFNELKIVYDENINDIVNDTHFKAYVFNVRIVQCEKLVKALKFTVHNMKDSQPLAQGDISLSRYEQAIDEMLSAIQTMIEGKPLFSNNVSVFPDTIDMRNESDDESEANEGSDNDDNDDNDEDDDNDDGHQGHEEGHEGHQDNQGFEDHQDFEGHQGHQGHQGFEGFEGFEDFENHEGREHRNYSAEDILRMETERQEREQRQREEQQRIQREQEEAERRRQEEEDALYYKQTDFIGMPNLGEEEDVDYYDRLVNLNESEIFQNMKAQLLKVNDTTDRYLNKFCTYFLEEVRAYIEKVLFDIPKRGRTDEQIVQNCLGKSRSIILPLFPDLEDLTPAVRAKMNHLASRLNDDYFTMETEFSAYLLTLFRSVYPTRDMTSDAGDANFKGMPPFSEEVSSKDYFEQINMLETNELKDNMSTQVSSIKYLSTIDTGHEQSKFQLYFTLETSLLVLRYAKQYVDDSKVEDMEAEEVVRYACRMTADFLTDIEPIPAADKTRYNEIIADLIEELSPDNRYDSIRLMCFNYAQALIEEKRKVIEATPKPVRPPRREPSHPTPMGPLVQDDEPHPEPAGPYNNATTKQNWDFEQEEYAKLKTYARSHPQPEYALKFLDRSKQALKDVIKFYLGYKYEFREGVGYVKTDEKIEKRYYDRLMNPTTYSEFTGGNGTLLQKLYNRIKAHHPEKRILFTKTSFKVFIDLLPSFNKKFQEVTGLPPRSQVYKFFGYHPVSRPRRT